MPTRTDLIVRVLDLLGVTQVGQDPSAEDVEKVDSFVSNVVVWLKDDRVATIDPANITPGEFEALATVVADATGPSFGQPRDQETVQVNKHALRIAQASEGGPFSRRRSADQFAGAAQRNLQAQQGFAGTQRTVLAASSGFAGSTERPLNASPGLAGAIPRPLQGSK